MVSWIVVNLIALLCWVTVLLLPSRPYRTRERLEAIAGSQDLGTVTVLIPARNEAAVIARTLAALGEQGPGLEIVIVDDGSDDGTLNVCREEMFRQTSVAADSRTAPTMIMLKGEPLPSGWGGKLWALEQGLKRVSRPYTLLLDADIVLAPGMLAALLEQARERKLSMVSIMARLHVANLWEKLLVPPFIFFFKLLYPFRAVNDANSSVAAAAGGCIFIETKVLRKVGAFGAIRDALIDDCALARRVKDRDHSVWLGLSHAVISTRTHEHLALFWRMITRTAFSQLRYSVWLLLATTGVIVVAFFVPVLTLLSADGWLFGYGLFTVGIMVGVFLPTVRFYELSWLWALALPLAAGLYLLMTWASALRYWRGTRAIWKNRTYGTVD